MKRSMMPESWKNGIKAAQTIDEPDPEPTPEPKPDPEPKPTPPAEALEVTVNGEKKVYTKEEAIEALSKVRGADAKFREAAEIRKKAERGMRIDSLFARIKGGEAEEEEVNELVGLLGIDPAAFAEVSVGPNGTKPEPKQKVTLDDLDPSLKQQLQFDAQQNIKRAEEQIRNDVKKRVDKDEILGKMNSVAVEVGNEDFIDAVTKMVHEDVLRKIRNGESYGTGMVDNSIQVTRARLKQFGIPDKVSKPKTLIVGAGAPGGEPLEIQPDEPEKRVDTNDAGYSDNLVKRVFQRLQKGAS